MTTDNKLNDIELVTNVRARIRQDWSVDRSQHPAIISAPASDSAIQASWVHIPEPRKPSLETARMGALNVVSFLQKQLGIKFVQARAVEYSREDETAAVWLDITPDTESDDRRFSVGRRDWQDGSFVVTWIGDKRDYDVREGVKALFDTVARTSMPA